MHLCGFNLIEKICIYKPNSVSELTFIQNKAELTYKQPEIIIKL